MRHRPAPAPRAQRGVGALVVVMSLFFIMSMVAAYASRNLIFEQRTSANNYRSTQAFEAAEAGLEWAIAMLNGGRVDATCVDSADPGLDTFRERHLSIDANGFLQARKWLDAGVETDLRPSCVLGANGWDCSCRSSAAPVLVDPAGAAPAPTFRITFETVVGQPGVVRVFSQGCSGFATQCSASAAVRSDAVAEVNALLGLAPSLTQTPTAALTVRGRLDASGALTVSNGDGATNGITVNAGDTVVAPDIVLASLPGSPAALSMTTLDPSLSAVTPAGALTGGEMMFLATFGAPPAAFRVQPAVVRMPCAVGCALALQTAAVQFPGRVLWIDGDLVIEDDAVVTLGSVAEPVILVVGGDIRFGSGSSVTINGMVYSRGARWVAGGSNALVQGAFVAEGQAAVGPDEGSFSIDGAPAIVFDTDVVERLKQAKARRVADFGSIVRVPGSWRDFR